MIELFSYFAIAIGISFLCSIMEAVLLSTPVSFLEAKKDMGEKKYNLLLEFKKNLDRPISAILSLNTVAHTLGAAGVGAQAVELFGDEYFGAISAVLTILILVFSEILPKTLGASYCKNIAPIAGLIIKFMVFLTYPLVLISEIFTRIFENKNSSSSISREELSAMAKIAEEEGIFAEKENKIIQNLIRLRSVNVSEVMTPRVVLAAADEEMTLEEFQTKKEFLHFSRIPIYSEDIEHITGYVFTQSVFEKLAEDQIGLKLKDLRRNIITVSDTMPLTKLWELLLEKKEHIAIIINEYGGMDGIVTMEDIIETLLGLEIVDEKDNVIDMQKYARERWKMRERKIQILDKSDSIKN